jgi:hypothetical protein
MEQYKNHIRQPLNLYSIFGYLLPGFFLISLLIIDFDGSTLITKYWENEKVVKADFLTDLKLNYFLDFFSSGTLSDFKFIPFVIFLLFCYLIGHVISALSSLFIERLLVKLSWGFPSGILVSGQQEIKYKWFFGNYRKPLKSQMINELKKSAKDLYKYDVNKEDYYWLFYSYIITNRPYLAPRVHHFVNLYGFSRNVCATFIIYIIFRICFLNWVIGLPLGLATWSILILFLFIAFFMFWNYIKLFKRQAVDIYFLFLSVIHDKNKESEN